MIPLGWGEHPRVYVTGRQLDAIKFSKMLGAAHGNQLARAVVVHELGHLVRSRARQ